MGLQPHNQPLFPFHISSFYLRGPPVGYGPATAVEGYGALALARQKQEAAAAERPEEEYYPE